MTDNDHTMHSPPAMTDDEGDGIPHRPLAGDHADDDGVALDQMFEAMNVGPQDYGIPDSPDDVPLPITTRIVSRTYPASTEPLMFLPADPNRQECLIRMHNRSAPPTPDPADEYAIRIASAKTDCYGAAKYFLYNLRNGGVYETGDVTVNLQSHTGPVWILSSQDFVDLQGEISVWTVTV